MKLRAVVMHLLFVLAGVLIMLHTNPLAKQKRILKTNIDPHKKGPPVTKTVDLTFLNAADRTIAKDGIRNGIMSSLQMKKGSRDELSDDIANSRTAPAGKRTRRVSDKTNAPSIIIKKNEFNQI